MSDRHDITLCIHHDTLALDPRVQHAIDRLPCDGEPLVQTWRHAGARSEAGRVTTIDGFVYGGEHAMVDLTRLLRQIGLAHVLWHNGEGMTDSYEVEWAPAYTEPIERVTGCDGQTIVSAHDVQAMLERGDDDAAIGARVRELLLDRPAWRADKLIADPLGTDRDATP